MQVKFGRKIQMRFEKIATKPQVGFFLTHTVCIVLGAYENASTEKSSTGGWNNQVLKIQVRLCRGGKCKYGKSKYKCATTEIASTEK